VDFECWHYTHYVRCDGDSFHGEDPVPPYLKMCFYSDSAMSMLLMAPDNVPHGFSDWIHCAWRGDRCELPDVTGSYEIKIGNALTGEYISLGQFDANATRACGTVRNAVTTRIAEETLPANYNSCWYKRN